MKLYCATSNPGKLREFRRAAEIYADSKIQISSLPLFDSMEPCEEIGRTIAENAVLKAEYYGARFGGLLFAEDSGLEVSALNGEPGVFSARWGGEGTDDETNNRLLMRRMQGVKDRSAKFVCVIALARNGRIINTFRGEAEGFILEEPRGEQGFGYDPLFFFPPLQRSFAELLPEEKLHVSHRGHALKALFHLVKNRVQPGVHNG
jgi:XTP/dITP diphosphohydrolase